MTSTTSHRDISQQYDGKFFQTLCSCGHAATGVTADDADFTFFEHLDTVSAAA